MSRASYEKIRAGVLRWEDNYFARRPDACGKVSTRADQKIVIAL